MAERTAHLRPRKKTVRPRSDRIELFYDLVYVLAVTQLTRHRWRT